MLVRQGERVQAALHQRLSAIQKHVIRLEGHTMKITHVDGNPTRRRVEVDAIEIGDGRALRRGSDCEQPRRVGVALCSAPANAERGCGDARAL